jgi:geranylgeranyl pyrophosphate synthase
LKINKVKFEHICNVQVNRIDEKISKLLRGKEPDSLYGPCTYIMQSGGKRLRPLLVLFSAKTLGAKFKDVLNAGAAVELLHNFTLVHDDIMDNSDKRRNLQTVHKKYDLSTAILTGDNLIAVAYISLLKDCKNNDKAVLFTFTKGVIEVCEGQSLDKDFEKRSDILISDYLIMISKKTAVLMEMCCSIGGRIAGGNQQEIRTLEKFGRNLGIAFQIQDDLLDIIGDESEFGKITGSDLIEGKKTFLLINALDKAEGNDRVALINLIADKGVKKEEISKYREIYNRLGVIDNARLEIIKYTERALSSLKNIKDCEGKQLLIELAESLIRRSK